MKAQVYAALPFLIFLWSCNNSTQKASTNSVADTPKAKSSIVLPDDTVTITIDSNNRAVYKWGDLRKIIKAYPAINADPAIYPDSAYSRKSSSKNDAISFSGELGKDNYCDLYTYFLKKKLDTAKYTPQARKLIKLYRYINDIYGNLALGGTFYGHQYSRIPAYAWYAIYLNKTSTSDITNDLSLHRKSYADSLKKFITIKINQNADITGKQKVDLKKKLFGDVNAMSLLITDPFYLQQTQRFQHSYYKNLPL